jgi:uncharacterized repeat protein (TIGR03833 family)
VSGPPPRSALKPGTAVDIVQKHDQRTGRLTRGVVAQLLTASATHPHGIKVRLTTGEVGRVQVLAAQGGADPHNQDHQN